MSGNLSQRKLAGIGVVAVLVIGAAWLLFGGSLRDGADTPQEAIQAIYQHCQAGEYGATARYYVGGPQNDAAMRQHICDDITLYHRMQKWEWKSQRVTGEGAVIETYVYRDAEARTGTQIVTWRLVRQGGRWLVVEV